MTNLYYIAADSASDLFDTFVYFLTSKQIHLSKMFTHVDVVK